MEQETNKSRNCFGWFRLGFEASWELQLASAFDHMFGCCNMVWCGFGDMLHKDVGNCCNVNSSTIGKPV
eukprot:15367026-Ditylum_brightwellii.AAC.2